MEVGVLGLEDLGETKTNDLGLLCTLSKIVTDVCEVGVKRKERGCQISYICPLCFLIDALRLFLTRVQGEEDILDKD